MAHFFPLSQQIWLPGAGLCGLSVVWLIETVIQLLFSHNLTTDAKYALLRFVLW